jgi:hypothetical protein
MAFLLRNGLNRPLKEKTMKRLMRIFILVIVALILYLSNARAVPITDFSSGQGGPGGDNKVSGEMSKKPV